MAVGTSSLSGVVWPEGFVIAGYCLRDVYQNGQIAGVLGHCIPNYLGRQSRRWQGIAVGGEDVGKGCGEVGKGEQGLQVKWVGREVRGVQKALGRPL